MKPVTDFELKFISEFLTTGIQTIPNPERSAYESDEHHKFATMIIDRLQKFYSLYHVKTPLYEEGDKEW